MASLKETFIQNLKELRGAMGLSQEKLAEKVGVSLTFVAHLESGRKSPSFETLDELGKALGVPAYRLILPPIPVDEVVIEEATSGLRDVVRKMFLVVDGATRHNAR